jgi:hypothetical protein
MGEGMNGKQIAILIIGLIIIIVMVLYPPWYDYQKSRNGRYSLGYHYITSRPARWALIDFWRLTGSAIIVVAAASIGMLLVRSKEEPIKG